MCYYYAGMECARNFPPHTGNSERCYNNKHTSNNKKRMRRRIASSSALAVVLLLCIDLVCGFIPSSSMAKVGGAAQANKRGGLAASSYYDTYDYDKARNMEKDR